jgi:small-conductance mechanosensitive channel
MDHYMAYYREGDQVEIRINIGGAAGIDEGTRAEVVNTTIRNGWQWVVVRIPDGRLTGYWSYELRKVEAAA